MTTFNDLNLDSQLIKAITELGYKDPTPVQADAIPQILEGLDILVSAQTGTGKTAAFLLPAIHKIVKNQKDKWTGPKMLILVPTRELAMQVAEESCKFSKYLPRMKTVCIYGGVPYPVQRKQLARPYEILVATPGRLIDFINQGKINLSSVDMLVLDEADRMLDMGFLEDVETISARTSENRQTMLFSATWDRRIMGISREIQNKPFEIKVKPCMETKKNISQHLYYTDGLKHKVKILDHILENTTIEQALVFTSTIRQAEDLCDELFEKGHQVGSLHGNMNQRQRTRAIDKMRKGRTKIMVATDVAARGIDILTISHVINFDLPMQAEDYVHRIGRTGRAGAKGTAISFAAHNERRSIEQIVRRTETPLEAEVIKGLEPMKKASPSSRAPFGRNRRFGGGGGGNRGGGRGGKPSAHRGKRFASSKR